MMDILKGAGEIFAHPNEKTRLFSKKSGFFFLSEKRCL